ncbi:hypothetical protein PC123_g18651 [Phytophthora cactorum]|nr:hypothetical protein PC123_g18651 [Phytophthora cactorum]
MLKLLKLQARVKTVTQATSLPCVVIESPIMEVVATARRNLPKRLAFTLTFVG